MCVTSYNPEFEEHPSKIIITLYCIRLFYGNYLTELSNVVMSRLCGYMYMKVNSCTYNYYYYTSALYICDWLYKNVFCETEI